jgi:hypothetical protein
MKLERLVKLDHRSRFSRLAIRSTWCLAIRSTKDRL